jgi:hypothetical protein
MTKRIFSKSLLLHGSLVVLQEERNGNGKKETLILQETKKEKTYCLER